MNAAGETMRAVAAAIDAPKIVPEPGARAYRLTEAERSAVASVLELEGLNPNDPDDEAGERRHQAAVASALAKLQAAPDGECGDRAMLRSILHFFDEVLEDPDGDGWCGSDIQDAMEPRRAELAGHLGLIDPKEGEARYGVRCAGCGSANVSRDAWADWSEQRQAWVLAEVCDAAQCHDCSDGPVASLSTRLLSGDETAPERKPGIPEVQTFMEGDTVRLKPGASHYTPSRSGTGKLVHTGTSEHGDWAAVQWGDIPGTALERLDALERVEDGEPG